MSSVVNIYQPCIVLLQWYICSWTGWVLQCCNAKIPPILSQPVATPAQIMSIAEHISISCFPVVNYV